MAERSGFFNALKTSAGYDIKYNANDYADNLAAIVSDGVRRSGDNDLEVRAAGGFALTIAPGRAWIKGRYYVNDAEYTAFSVPTPPVGDRGRIDRIALRLDTAVDARRIRLVYKTGEPGTEPQAPALERAGSVWEIAIADISVAPAAPSISQNNITDRRGDNETKQDGLPIGGWITTPVGYDDFWVNLDAAFNDWFTETRDRVASVTMYREYHQRATAETATTAVTITIPQYDPTGPDIIKVAINGLQAVEGIDYTLSGTAITFSEAKAAGTDIDITCVKSIDGTGLGSVQDAVEELQEQVAEIKNIGEYIYICNGLDDNVKLSEIARAFFAEAAENAQLLISVYGTFGATAPDSGDGSATSRYRWINAGSGTASETRRLVLDFANSSPLTFEGQAGKHYIAFYGAGATVRNVSLVCRQRNTEGTFAGFVAPGNAGFLVEASRIDINAYTGSYIAGAGTFRDCFGIVNNSRADSFCFALEAGKLLRAFGGTYRAYTQLSGSRSAVFGESGAGGAIGAFGVNCPTLARSGYYQTHAAYFAQASTKGVLTGTITALPVGTATGGGVVIRDTIAASMADPTF